MTAGETFTETPLVDPNASCLTAQGSSGANEIIFQRSGAGANPVNMSAGIVGTGPDSGICIQVGDFITFNGIDITATSSALEHGYRVVNASATNGANNNTILNTTVTLNRTGTATIGIVQSTVAGTGGGITPTASAGANSFNQYCNLTIKNVYQGIYLLGTGAFPDQNCAISVTGAVTANIIGDPNTPK